MIVALRRLYYSTRRYLLHVGGTYLPDHPLPSIGKVLTSYFDYDSDHLYYYQVLLLLPPKYYEASCLPSCLHPLCPFTPLRTAIL